MPLTVVRRKFVLVELLFAVPHTSATFIDCPIVKRFAILILPVCKCLFLIVQKYGGNAFVKHTRVFFMLSQLKGNSALKRMATQLTSKIAKAISAWEVQYQTSESL